MGKNSQTKPADQNAWLIRQSNFFPRNLVCTATYTQHVKLSLLRGTFITLAGRQPVLSSLQRLASPQNWFPWIYSLQKIENMSNDLAEIEEATLVATETRKKDIGHHDGDCIKTACGDEIWYYDGVLHRLDGPAIILADGRKEWYKNGNLHRDDGPALDGPTFKAWYKDGVLHRVGGPAIITSAYETWWENGVFLRGTVF